MSKQNENAIVRLRYGSGQRQRYVLKGCPPALVKKRAAELRTMAKALRKADQSEAAPLLLGKAADAAGDAERFAEVQRLVRGLCVGKYEALSKRQSDVELTFRKVGEQWTSGDLHRRFPDQVGDIFQDFNVKRLERHVYPVIGDRPIAAVTREHCDEVMRQLPSTLKSRRHIAALVSRILNLAELAGYIERNPLPRGWLPRPLPRKAWAILYPSEDRQLLADTTIPLCYRVLWGFLHREGMRRSEAAALSWRDLDLENGVVRLEQNKTDHARWWPLAEGVADALAAWWEHRERPASSDFVFTEPDGRPLSLDGLAELAREHLRQAGLRRPELFEARANWGRFGTHSFRRSFVTRALANERTEDWVRRRSGHKSAELLRYRQAAQGLAELRLGEVDPLFLAIPEFTAAAFQGGPQSGPRIDRVGRNTEQTASLLY